MKDFWDNRYQYHDYAYGTQANDFLKEVLPKYPPGRILFPADGEGRNSVYAATLGWVTDAFDISTEGRRKALQLAESAHTSINYLISDLKPELFPVNHYDAISLIYAHFPSEIRNNLHAWVRNSLKSNGVVILEAFSISNLEFQKMNPYIGGPSDVDMLYTLSELESSFDDFDIRYSAEKEIELHEGKYHNGIGSVVRFEAVKR
jgi:hypothetical protein